jgi:hypothetical protein
MRSRWGQSSVIVRGTQVRTVMRAQTSIASASVLARGVDHLRGGIVGGCEESGIVEDHRLDAPATRAAGAQGKSHAVRFCGALKGTLVLSRSPVGTPCRISDLGRREASDVDVSAMTMAVTPKPSCTRRRGEVVNTMTSLQTIRTESLLPHQPQHCWPTI